MKVMFGNTWESSWAARLVFINTMPAETRFNAPGIRLARQE